MSFQHTEELIVKSTPKLAESRNISRGKGWKFFGNLTSLFVILLLFFQKVVYKILKTSFKAIDHDLIDLF